MHSNDKRPYNIKELQPFLFTIGQSLYYPSHEFIIRTRTISSFHTFTVQFFFSNTESSFKKKTKKNSRFHTLKTGVFHANSGLPKQVLLK